MTRLLLTISCLVLATNAARGDSTSGFPQYPSLSPDGSMTVFSLGGDLWSVPTGGGHAERLTSNESSELRSSFSPDGTLLAFESNRNGATSLHVMPVEMRGQRLVATGPIQRVVTSDRNQYLSGFTPDGQSILFWGYREPSLFRESGLYQAPLDGGPVITLTSAKGDSPRMNDDQLVFSRGGAPMERPRYRGSSNQDIWSMQRDDGSFRRLTEHRGNDSNAHPMPNGDVLFVSSRDGQNNLWRLPAGAGEDDLVQITTRAPSEGQTTIGHGIRDLTVSKDGSTAVFGEWDQLYRVNLDQPDSTATMIDLRVNPDQSRPSTRKQKLDDEVDEAVLHPSGEAMAFAARGQLLVRNVEDDHPTKLITSDHARDGWISFSPDGDKLYFTSDRSGHEGIWAVTVALSRADLEPEEDEDEGEDEGESEGDEGSDGDTSTDETDPPKTEEPSNQNATKASTETSDDSGESEDSSKADDEEDEDEKDAEENESGKRWAEALRFEFTPVVVDENANHHPMPSPDGRSLIYLRDRGDVHLLDLATGEDRLLLESWWPPEIQWTSDSRHIIYAKLDLDFNSDVWLMDVNDPEGTTNLTRHPDLDESPRISDDGKVVIFRSDRNQIGTDDAYDVYRIFLDETLAGLSEWERTKHFEEAAKVAGKKKIIDLVDLEADHEPVDAIAFENLDTAWNRSDRLTSFDGAEDDLLLSPGGDSILFSAKIDGTQGLYKVDAMGKNRKKLTTGSVADLRMIPSGKTISYISGGNAKTMPMTGGSSETIGIDADAEIMISQEQSQKFDETARLFGRWFYHPDMKGLDWDAMTDRYGELAMTTRTPQAFNRVVNMLFGEVDASHTGIYGGGGFSTSNNPIGYLGIATTPVPGGYEVTGVLEKSPAAHPESELLVGDVILGVNDVTLADSRESAPTIDLSRAMDGTRNKETILEISRDGEDHTMLIKPVSWSAWNGLAYQDELKGNREMVDDLSDGQLGYLHIRGMNMASVHEFEHQLYAAAHGKDGLVIDVRNNGGGWTTDVLLTSLTAPVHSSTIPRGVAWEDAPKEAYPRDRRLIYAWSKPIVVLANEHSFSNAEIFTHAIKNTDRGTVVGEETFGGVISTGSFTLVDGSRVRRPFRGWRLPDGTDMEAMGAMPDIRVLRTPEDEAAGKDRQLEVAVEELRSRIQSEKADG